MVDGWLAPAMTEAQADLYPFTVPHMPLSPKWRHPDRSRLSGEGKDLARAPTTASRRISHPNFAEFEMTSTRKKPGTKSPGSHAG
jgi:hypothetical protein